MVIWIQCLIFLYFFLSTIYWKENFNYIIVWLKGQRSLMHCLSFSISQKEALHWLNVGDLLSKLLQLKFEIPPKMRSMVTFDRIVSSMHDARKKTNCTKQHNTQNNMRQHLFYGQYKYKCKSEMFHMCFYHSFVHVGPYISRSMRLCVCVSVCALFVWEPCDGGGAKHE